ncbi:metal-sensing transcriptional repressor, partial [Selenomonas sp.]|uniref:metal-sensing transcriptional repressor n=1 Tax=Selenomonas sp. TaxID=2053611 RepID=UPI00345B7929
MLEETAPCCHGGEESSCAGCVKHKHRDKSGKEYKCLISRLKRIEGQVRGVTKMVED